MSRVSRIVRVIRAAWGYPPAEIRLLSVSMPMNTNRLVNEKSPYLLQHANNPVDWYPWGEEAFDKAKETNKLIFLSVGYSTCHWCHVMAHESFEDVETAKIMNDNYINIKVDREERPDVDKIYMLFVQAITGGGGWPQSVFLTPDLKPVYGGTYFPPHNMYGRPGFRTILKFIAEQWRNEGDEMVSSSDSILSQLELSVQPEKKSLPSPESLMKSCYNHLNERFDESHKGFLPSPKFPSHGDFHFLLYFYRVYHQTESGKNALRMVGETLKAISLGGIHDHIGKGFHRYAVDVKWHVPHFEKMLYDQAQLLSAFSIYHQITGEMGDIIEDIAEYVKNNLTHKDGGFYSAEDADSLPEEGSEKKKEGAYYVWTESEINDALGTMKADEKGLFTYADVVKEYFCVEPNGNVPHYADPHDEFKNQNILVIRKTPESIAEKFPNCCVERLIQIIEEAKHILATVRQQRPKPHLDNKMVTAWNALMITGLAKAASALQNTDLLERAKKALFFVIAHLFDSERLLRTCYVDQNGKICQISNPILAYADDYALLIQALLDLYDASYEESFLKLAASLQTEMDKRFWDAESRNGYFHSDDMHKLIFRMRTEQDGAEPSFSSVASCNLLRLGDILNRSEYKEKAHNIFEGTAEHLTEYPNAFSRMVVAYQRMNLQQQVVVVGSRNNEVIKAMLLEISKRYDPNRILISVDPEQDTWLLSMNEHLRTLVSSTTTPTVYICENFACNLPITSFDKLKERLDVH